MVDASQFRTSREVALSQRTACAFVPGMGYVRLGEHPMPPNPINPPAACLPPPDTEDGSLHQFTRRGGTEPSVTLRWLADFMLWEPESPGMGNRMAFRPAYLAACGWRLFDG